MLPRRIAGPSSCLRTASLLLKAKATSPSSVAAAFTTSARKPSSENQSSCFASVSSKRSADLAPPRNKAGAGGGGGDDAAAQCPLLEPPWQLGDLRRFEREAWELHGPAMLDHLPTPQDRELALGRVKTRSVVSEGYRKKLGPNWYAIMAEARRLRNATKWYPTLAEMRPVCREETEKLEVLMQQLQDAVEAGASEKEILPLRKAVKQQNHVVYVQYRRNEIGLLFEEARQNLGLAEEE